MITIRAYMPDDWNAVDRIYREGLETGIATFETEPKSQMAFEGKSVKDSGLVAIVDREIVGWAILWPVSDRCVYGGVGEVSVYVAASARGRGVGMALLEALVKRSEDLGFWTLQAGIFEENTPSQALHTACGFRVLGVRERIGQLRGVWHNNVLMERRSKVVGT